MDMRFDEDNILITCAMRFNGYHYAELAGFDMVSAVENCLHTDNIDLPLFERMTVFFALQRFLYVWGGEYLPKTSPEWKLFRQLFFTVCEYDSPREYQSESCAPKYDERWRSVYKPVIDQVRHFIRLIHENTIYDELAEEQLMSNGCKWLHEQLEDLPMLKYPFHTESLPRNGIYFFYEDGEAWGHGGDKPRIVQIGTHKEGNFRSRISEHFLIDDAKMDFESGGAAPKDRSIFRKNIGRALLNKNNDDYLRIWEIDFTLKDNRAKYSSERSIEKEKLVEAEITKMLRDRFSLKFIILESQAERMGNTGLKSRLIGTVANCECCKPSDNWIGKHSPVEKIRTHGLWLVQHLGSSGITGDDKAIIANAVATTHKWISETNNA